MGIEQPRTPEQKQKDKDRAEAYKRAKDYALKLFTEQNEEEINDTYDEIRFFAGIAEIDPEVIIEGIKKGFALENPGEFVDLVFGLLKEVIDKKIEHPELFEEAQRERAMQQGANINLSKLVYCDIDYIEGMVFIHIAPKGDLNFGEIIKSFREGFMVLAKIVEKDERIKEIQAVSWIVARNPKLVEQFGFVVDGPVEDRYYEDDKEKPVWKAHMSREALLEKYAKFKNRSLKK